mmetsp:Transcript_111125/g.313536  ORF Transcript_111125/g.313536 Transcript_111125/m.313536 type:complete len:277 (-) Transcript_111125:942-1772(-)
MHPPKRSGPVCSRCPPHQQTTPSTRHGRRPGKHPRQRDGTDGRAARMPLLQFQTHLAAITIRKRGNLRGRASTGVAPAAETLWAEAAPPASRGRATSGGNLLALPPRQPLSPQPTRTTPSTQRLPLERARPESRETKHVPTTLCGPPRPQARAAARRCWRCWRYRRRPWTPWSRRLPNWSTSVPLLARANWGEGRLACPGAPRSERGGRKPQSPSCLTWWSGKPGHALFSGRYLNGLSQSLGRKSRGTRRACREPVRSCSRSRRPRYPSSYPQRKE